MEKLILIAMPVMEVDRPSISLTQLKAVVDERLGDRVDVEILYLNHDFAEFLAEGAPAGAPDLHQVMLDNQHTGLPEWFFRQAAFPSLPDNSIEYFRRYYPGRAPALQALKDALQERRNALVPFLNRMIDRHRIHEAKLVGFTSMFAQNVASFALARMLKERNPNITIVVGGANCESPMGQQLVQHVDAVDYVFSGPGLLSFPAFVDHWIAGRTADCESIRGVFSKARPERDGHDQFGDELPLEVPVPLEYDAFFESFAQHFPRHPSEPMVLFETSRGCWWGQRAHCTFCGLNGATMEYRAMPAQHAITLFRSLFAQYRAKTSYFFNVDNIMPKNWVKEVLPFIEAPEGTRIFYEVKANLEDEDLRVMSAAGIRRIQPGIEALATPTLKKMMKGTTAFVNLTLLKNCIRYDIEPVWNLLVGFPGEEAEIYAKYVADIPRLSHLPPPQGVAPVRFDRFSPYFNKATEYGLKLKCFDYYPMIYPFAPDVLARMAYFFFDEHFDAPYIKTLSQWIGKLRAVIHEWRARWEQAAVLGLPRLTLERNGERGVVLDSRSGPEREIALEPSTLRLLDHLDKAHRLPDLLAFGAEHAIDVERELALLDAERLIWREEDRYLGLVIDGAAMNTGAGSALAAAKGSKS